MSDLPPPPELVSTVAAYDAHAASYAAGLPSPDDAYLAGLDRFVAALPAGARVLEIGSGSGRDALLLEERGVCVQRSDVSQGFVDLMAAAGQPALLLDPLVDDLGGPWDAVYASASLLHVRRDHLPLVLRRLRGCVRVGGLLVLDLKEGDGEGWSTHGNIPVPRHFTYWRETGLRVVLGSSGWVVGSVERWAGRTQATQGWLHVTAIAGEVPA